MPKITPFLWFDGRVEEAVTFYTSVFKNAKVGHMRPGPKGTVMSASFTLEGQEFIALNGGPQYAFTPAVSFFVNCETQEEVDYFWNKLLEGGKEDRCGWLRDKFGLSWQIIPSALGKLMGDPDPAKSQRVMKAMLGMQKLEIAGLQRAYDGKE
jgi:predicted 3-demethylubiquinone-9 3-methyltransferase (glyoxalase superfamily)